MTTPESSLLVLPMEVLVMIAKLCLEEGIVPGMKSLVALRATCRALRAIVTPVLLNRIFIATNKGFQYFMQHLDDESCDNRQIYDLTIGQKTCSDSMEYGDAWGCALWNPDEYWPSANLSVLLNAANHFQTLRLLQIRGGTWRQLPEDQVGLERIDPSTCFPALETFIFTGFEYHMAMEELMFFWTAPRLKVCIVRVRNLDFSKHPQSAPVKYTTNELEPVEYLHLLVNEELGQYAANALVRARNAKKLALGLRKGEEQAISRHIVIDSFARQLEGLDLTFCPNAPEGSILDYLRHYLDRCVKLKSITLHPYMVEHIRTFSIGFPADLEELRIFGFEHEMRQGIFFPSLTPILLGLISQLLRLRYVEIKSIPRFRILSLSPEPDASVGTDNHSRDITVSRDLERHGIWELSKDRGFELRVSSHDWVPHNQNSILKDQETVEWDIQRGRKSVEMQDCRLMDID